MGDAGDDDLFVRIQDRGAEEVLKVIDGTGVDAVVETTASAAGFGDALSAVRKDGSVVLVGGYHKPLEIHPGRIVGGEIRLTGSSCYGYSGMRKDFEWSTDLISSGRVAVSKLVTHRFPLDDIKEAFEIAADKKTGSIKVLIHSKT